MKTRTRIIRGLLGLAGWIGVGASIAQAGAIVPIGAAPAPPLGTPAVTFSIFKDNGAGVFVDVTDTWLPEWHPVPGQPIAAGGEVVFVVVNSGGLAVTPTTIGLVLPPAAVTINGMSRSTSNYAGQCTNYGLPTDLSPDFDLNPVAATLNTATGPQPGFQLTPLDCGGTAILQATVGGIMYTAALPLDTNGNGIPVIWSAIFCPATNPCPIGNEDTEIGPAGNAVPGDGISAFDEYRGFIVSGVHIRTDPRQKDLFVHVVNPQCQTKTGGTASLLPAFFPDLGGFFANVDTLVSGTQVHLLGNTPGSSHLTTDEWVDKFFRYTVATGVQYKLNPTDPDTAATTTAPPEDRQINLNARYPIGGARQKGLRITECLDNNTASPLGVAGLGSPNGPDNAILYTQRIVDSITGLINAGAGRALQYFTYVNGVVTPQVLPVAGGSPAAAANVTFLIAGAMQFYLAMELGHSVQLTPTVEGTSKTSYGFHHAPGTGSNLDQAITTKVDSKASGFNSFYIPFFYNSFDQGSAKFK